MSIDADFIDSDEKCRFTDPYNVKFIERIQSTVRPDGDMIHRFNEVAGARVPKTPMQFNAEVLLGAVFQRLRAELLASSDPNARAKIAWLYNRIAPRIQSPEGVRR
jgi:hypothetical protein